MKGLAALIVVLLAANVVALVVKRNGNDSASPGLVTPTATATAPTPTPTPTPSSAQPTTSPTPTVSSPKPTRTQTPNANQTTASPSPKPTNTSTPKSNTGGGSQNNGGGVPPLPVSGIGANMFGLLFLLGAAVLGSFARRKRALR
jgi:hypothetical protein